MEDVLMKDESLYPKSFLGVFFDYYRWPLRLAAELL